MMYIRQDRFLVPSELPVAIDFYLDSLAIPHSRREMVRLSVLRSLPVATSRSILSTFREEAGNVSEMLSAITGSIEKQLRLAGVVPNIPISCIALEDYYNSNRDQTVLYVFDETAVVPIAIGKVTSHSADLLHAEFQALCSMRQEGSRSFQDSIPKPLALFYEGPYKILLESLLPGRSMYFEMRNRWVPVRSASDHFDAAKKWLVSFQTVTRKREFQVAEFLEKQIDLVDDDSLKCPPSLREKYIPEVSRHGDFWAKNCIVQGDRFGVVDWEKFRASSCPFYDPFSFATSYALSFAWERGKWWMPVDACRAGFYERNDVSDAIRKFLISYCHEMNVSAELLRIFFPLFLAEKAQEEARENSVSTTWRDILHEHLIQKQNPCFT